jgi:hypothetical protein
VTVDVLQIAFGVLSLAACIGLAGLGVAWRRWTLVALALAAVGSTALYCAVALGAPATDAIIVLSGLTRTIMLLGCVAAALGSQGTTERLRALMARRGGVDPDKGRWQA